MYLRLFVETEWDDMNLFSIFFLCWTSWKVLSKTMGTSGAIKGVLKSLLMLIIHSGYVSKRTKIVLSYSRVKDMKRKWQLASSFWLAPQLMQQLVGIVKDLIEVNLNGTTEQGTRQTQQFTTISSSVCWFSLSASMTKTIRTRKIFFSP